VLVTKVIRPCDYSSKRVLISALYDEQGQYLDGSLTVVREQTPRPIQLGSFGFLPTMQHTRPNEPVDLSYPMTPAERREVAASRDNFAPSEVIEQESFNLSSPNRKHWRAK
jgi:hypothetical protein